MKRMIAVATVLSAFFLIQLIFGKYEFISQKEVSEDQTKPQYDDAGRLVCYGHRSIAWKNSLEVI